MAKVKIQGNASGAGIFTITPPATATDRTLTLPDATGTLINTAPSTSGYVLTSDGTNWTSAAAAAGGDLSFGGDTFGANKTIGSNDNYALSFETNATERLQLTNDGRGLSQFTAKMWINMNGSSTIAIRDSHNVSSITDNGTGDFTATFSNAMGNTNYSIAGTSGPASNTYASHIRPQTTATTSVRIRCYGDNNVSASTQVDPTIINMVIFGD